MPHLWPSIETALGQSRYLILLASPEAARLDLTSKAIANPRFGRAQLHTWPAAIRGMVHA